MANFITILDRLTRLEPAYVRFERVFDDIINKFYINEKPKNLTPAVNDGALLPDKAVIIPLRTAFIESNTVSVKGNSKEYIPLRVDPSGKTYFYDGFVSF